jgi:hypothetical protein
MAEGGGRTGVRTLCYAVCNSGSLSFTRATYFANSTPHDASSSKSAWNRLWLRVMFEVKVTTSNLGERVNGANPSLPRYEDSRVYLFSPDDSLRAPLAGQFLTSALWSPNL